MSVNFPNSHEFELEQAVKGILTPINDDITPITPPISIYTTNRIGPKVSPYISISARTIRQLIQPYSGVYQMEVNVEYVIRTLNGLEVEEPYQYVFALLYDEATTLAYKINFNSNNLQTYMARISAETPSVQTNRAYRKSITISAIVTPNVLGDGIRFYDFSDELNSFYLATI